MAKVSSIRALLSLDIQGSASPASSEELDSRIRESSRVSLLKGEVTFLRFLSRIRHLFGFSCVGPDHFSYPRAEGRDFGVDARGLLCPAGVAPRRDPVNHPAPSRTLTHQRASAVATATVHAPLWLDAAGAEHPAGEGAVEVLLAVAAGE